MKKILILFLVVAPFTISCNNDTKQRELYLKEKELALKQQELNQNRAAPVPDLNSAPVAAPITDTASTNPLSNKENLIGNWFTPHGAEVNISFERDDRFSFNDYNGKLERMELLTGKYTLENGKLTLLYDDRPKQSFKFYAGKKGDDHFYIKKSGYYFVKGEPGT